MPARIEQDGHSAESRPLDELTITVVHDNYPCVESLRTAWGFAAYIAGAEKSILFDTGSDGTLLLENMAKLQIDPAGIDVVVLSHVHGDHAGGLAGLLDVNPRVHVYLPESFPARVKDLVRGRGASMTEVGEPQQICGNVYSTGSLGRRIQEQALAIRTQRGLVILTGCAHPGVARIVSEIHRQHPGDIALVMGGFHLEWTMSRRVRGIIAGFRECGVRCVAPTHCSGVKAREQFREAYGRQFIEVGAGKVVTLAALP
ncbi:MAG TPA: MBL fold metallo-hydrolase [Sedimentisphaerales bacterium]|nr:MBL fold metallo-hydrolase [Sedimentisphaerales bacterium]HNU31260.1 MBL fold metallo-hydrolase [Sedimentisphaerales bacterium]